MVTDTSGFDDAKREWWEWHKANPAIWTLFERFTLEAINRGHKRLSPWLIINRIRWEVNVITTGPEFKISNGYIAYYSRLFMTEYPEYRGFFRTKVMKGETGDEWKA